MVLDAHVATFAYRRGEARLHDVRLSLDRGRTVLLGPNSVPTGRRRSAAFRRLVGWLPQDVAAFPGLSAREHVAYVGWLKGMPMSQAVPEARRALDTVGLGARAGDLASTLSGGQTRRLGIAGVLVHDPTYLLLDEPTAGLDPRERERLVGILRRIEEERAVLVSTHDTDALIESDTGIHVLTGGVTRFSGSYAAFVAGHSGAAPADRVRLAYAALVPEE